VEGLFAGGATAVSIVDGHGSGNPDPDLRADLLDPRATQVFRNEWFDAYVDLVERGAYDAIGVVGAHAKTGSGGFASHTRTLGIDFAVNGQSITETELIALSWGRVDVPIIFVSGDDRLHDDLRTMPWLRYAEVKKATSASTAALRPVEAAHVDLREMARQAVENISSAKVLKFQSPSIATLRAVHPARLDFLDGFPGLDYEDNSVSFEVDDFLQAHHGFEAIMNVATLGYTDVLMDVVGAHPDVQPLMDAYRDSVFSRWLDVESGLWASPVPAPVVERERYYGF